jgi:hypothetical protein
MVTDEQIIQLFADANPRPNADHRVPAGGDGHGRLDGAEITMIDLQTEQPADALGRSRRRPLWLLAPVAAVLFVLLVALVSDGDDERRAPATQPDSPTVASGRDLTAVMSFIDAYNAFDAEGAAALVAPDAEIGGSSAEELPASFDWRRAFDWTVQDVDCAAVDDRVRCTYTVDDRLTRYHGVERPGVMQFAFDADGRIEQLDVDEDLSRYSPQALEPFVDWVASEHPEDLTVLWTFEGGVAPNLTAEAIAAMGERLGEYTAGPEPPMGANRAFLTARAAGDAAAIDELLAPDATVEGMWIDDPAEFPALLAFFEATRWSWRINSCGLDDPGHGVAPVVLECRYGIDTAWSDAGLFVRNSGVIRLTLSEEGITDVRNRYRTDHFDERFAPWFEWLDQEHPGDRLTMYRTVEGIEVPQLTPEALALFETRVAEFVATAE